MIEYAGSATLIQWIYSGGTLDISGDTRNVSITPALETIDTTAGADQSGQFLPSFTDWEIAWDGVALNGTAGVTYAQAMIPGSEGTVIVYPFGTAGTVVKYTMQSLCMGAVIDMPYSDVTVISNTWRTASGGSLKVGETYTDIIKALSPIAYWPLNEPVGTTGAGSVLDASGNSRTGTPDGVTFGVTGIGDGNTAVSLPGSVSNIDVYTASLAAAFVGGEFTVAGWFKVAAGVWDDAAYRSFFHLRADANNYLLLDKSGYLTGNMRVIYNAAGTTQSTNPIATTSPAGWFHIAVSVSKSGNFVKVYIDGADQALGLTGLDTWAGSLAASTTVIGAQDLGGTSVWSGSIAHVAIFPLLSDAQILSLASF